MGKLENKTKDNHYVTIYYLKTFLNENSKIYQGDLKTGIVYKKNESELKTMCEKTNIYTIKTKITDTDISRFKEIFNIDLNDKVDEDLILKLVKFLNDELADLEPVQIKNNKVAEDEINKNLKDKINNPGISREQESLFTLYEEDFNPVYDKILQDENISFLKQKTNEDFESYLYKKVIRFIYKQFSKKALYETSIQQPTFPDFVKDDYYDFLHCIIIQYFRTEKIMDIFENILKSYSEKPAHLLFLTIHYKCIKLVCTLLNNNFKVVLIKNNSKADFITSDNPSINIYSSIVNGNLSGDEFEIYFPLSHKLAVLYSKKDCYKNIDDFTITTEKEIDIWNNMLKDNAKRYIYGSSKSLLKRYLKK